MGIIAWIIFDLIAGIIAKLIMPGRDGGGSISGFNLHSFLVAVVGAILVLGIFRLLRRE